MQKRFLAICMMVSMIFGTIGQNPFASAGRTATARPAPEAGPDAEFPFEEEFAGDPEEGMPGGAMDPEAEKPGAEDKPEEGMNEAGAGEEQKPVEEEKPSEENQKPEEEQKPEEAKSLGTTITTSDGSTYEIEVTYPDNCGVPTEGTELLVSEILPDEADYDSYVAASMEQLGAEDERVLFARVFDITIADKKDHSIVYEPNGEVRVSIRLTGTDLDAYAKVDVLHITEQKTRGTKSGAKAAPARSYSVDKMKSSKGGDTVTFATNGFSVYVIVGHEGGDVETPRVEFHYIAPNGTESVGVYTAAPYCFANQSASGPQDQNNVFWTQIVRDGDVLAFVPTPSDVNDSHFEGWYVVQCVSETVSTLGKTGTYSYRWPKNPVRQSFDKTVAVAYDGTSVSYTIDGTTYSGTPDATGCLHIYLAPLYTNYRFVDFNDYDGNLVARKLLVLDSDGESTICISDVTTINPDSEHYFMGWSLVPFGSQTSANSFLIYHDGYIVDTFITLKDNGDGTFAVYSGSTADGTPKIADYSSGTSNVILYGKFEMAHWLRFVAGENGWGALYVPADYLVGDDPAENLPTTERPGYVFSGWWTGWQDESGVIYYVQQVTDNLGHVLDGDYPLIHNDENGSQTANGVSSDGVNGSASVVQTGSISGGKLTMTDHSYLFAKWTPNTEAKYTVVIWQQKVTDSVDADFTPAQYEAWKAAYKAANPSAGDADIEAAFTAANHAVKQYDYTSSSERTCSDTSQPVGSTTADRSQSFTGFHLSDNVTEGGNTLYSYDVDAIVDPQGTTVFNVYYDRNVHTFTFQDNFEPTTSTAEDLYGKTDTSSYFKLSRSGNYWNGYTFSYDEYTIVENPAHVSGYYGLPYDTYYSVAWNNYYNSWVCNGNLYSGNIYEKTTKNYTGTRYIKRDNNWTTVKVIRALYGQDISSYFPIVGDNGIVYSHGERWDDTGSTYDEVVVIVNQMPDTNVTFHLDVALRDVKTLNYYVEALDSEAYDMIRDGIRYRLFSSVKVNVNFSTREDNIDIYGFMKNGSDPEFVDDKIQNSPIINFFYLREKYSLTYDMNYPGDAKFTESGTPSSETKVVPGIPYQTVLSSYASYVPECIPDHYVFDGWYEDASGTIRYDFDDAEGIQAPEIIYAKWYPVYYLIQINPNGGTLAGVDASNQSTYFWLQYGTTIGRYDTLRNYLEVDSSDPSVAADMAANPADYFYYRYVNFNQFEHARWSGYNVADLYYVDPSDTAAIDAEKDNEGIKPSFDRLAEYVSLADYHTTADEFYQYLVDHVQADSSYQDQSTADYWDSCYVDTTHVYRRIGSGDLTYTLVGWYSDGQPYDFSSAVTKPITLTAVWRQSGTYRLHYSANMTELVNGTLVMGTLTNAVYDPSENDEGYADGAEAVVGTAPSGIHGGSGDDNVYIFEGWRLVNSSGNPIDESGNVITSGTGTLYQPGDTFTVKSSMATGNIIYMEAYYRNVSDSQRRPQTVNLILDANEAFYGDLVPAQTSDWTWVKPGTVQADTTNKQILFGDTQSNVEVHLVNYKDSFVNTNHYFLLGYDEGSDNENAYSTSNPNGLRSGAPFVASYATDGIIGIDLRDPYPNKLYAVWEPMVYATFVNDTAFPITLTLNATGSNTLSIVNEAGGIYERTPLSGNTVTVAAGEQVRIVLPYGQGEQITATTTNDHYGYRMSVSSAFAGNATEEATLVTGSQSVEYQGTTTITDTLHFDTVGIIVTYTEVLTPKVTFDVNGGAWMDVATGTDKDKQYVRDQDNTDLYVITADAIDYLNRYKPEDPTLTERILVGWTLYPAIAEHSDFSGTSAVTWGSGEDEITITPDSGSTLLTKIRDEYLWDFRENPPFGQKLYAVWSETVRVTFNISSNYGNHSWEDQSGLYSGSGATRTIDIIKGDVVPQPANPTTTRINGNPSFLYWVYNPSNPNLAYENYKGSTTTPSNIPVENIFDFSKPVNENTTLCTSWTGASSIPITITKQISDVCNDTEKEFTFNYSIRTYYYTSNNTATPSVEGDVITGSFTLHGGESETISLYYWGRNNNPYYFYFQTVEIAEEDYSEVYDLTIGSLSYATESNGIVTIDPFTGEMSYSSSGSRRNFKHSDGYYYYRVSDNTWYTSAGGNTQATFPIQSATATFTNTRKFKDVTVEKKVTGGSGSDQFTFTATVYYKGSVVTGYDTNDFTDGVRIFQLRADESVGLMIPYGTLLVIEEDALPSGCMVAVTSTDFTDEDTADNSFTVAEVTEDGKILFTNTMRCVAPTEADTSKLPFMVLLLAGFVLLGGFFIVRKKKED